MTTQEFVQKEARMEAKLLFSLAEESESMLIAKEEYKNGFFNGLTKGLEIAEAFAEWVSELRNANAVMRIIDKRPASELLTIFLTEKYGK